MLDNTYNTNKNLTQSYVVTPVHTWMSNDAKEDPDYGNPLIPAKCAFAFKVDTTIWAEKSQPYIPYMWLTHDLKDWFQKQLDLT